MLLLELSTPQGPELHLTCLQYRGLSFIWRVYSIEVSAAPGVVYTTRAWAPSDVSTLQRLCCSWRCLQSTPQGPELHLCRVYTTKPCAAPGVVYTTGAWPASDVSTLHYRGLCCTGRCLHYRGLSCIYDVSTLQRPVLLLELSSPYGAWAASDVSTIQRPVLFLELFTPQEPELHWRVYTTEAWAAPGVVYCTPQRPELHLKCLHYRGLSCSWSCLLYTTGALAASDVSTLQRPLLLLELYTVHHRGTTETYAAPGVVYTTGAWAASDVSTLQSPVLHLKMFTQQWPELHLDLSTLQMSVLHLDVSTPHRPELHLNLAGKQEPVLLLDMSTLQGHELHLDVYKYVDYSSLCCTWTCLIHRDQCCWMICSLLFLEWLHSFGFEISNSLKEHVRFVLK